MAMEPSQVKIVASAGQYSGTAKAVMGPTFEGRKEATHFQLKSATKEVSLLSFDNVAFSTKSAMLYDEDKFIPRTRYLLENSETQFDRIEACDPKLPGTYVIGFNRGWRNYFHWMMQAMPAIFTSKDELQNKLSYLVIPELNAWHRRTLELVGLGDVPTLVVRDKEVLLETAIFAEFLNGSTVYEISTSTTRVHSAMSDAVDGRLEISPYIYVSRSDTSHRKLENELELSGMLKDLGFAIVVPGQFSVEDQIRMFRQAKVVVGPHGAGLTNIVFSREGAKFYELIQDHYINPCFARLSQLRGLEYHLDIFPSSTEGHGHHRGFSVDVNLIKEQVCELLR